MKPSAPTARHNDDMSRAAKSALFGLAGIVGLMLDMAVYWLVRSPF